MASLEERMESLEKAVNRLADVMEKGGGSSASSSGSSTAKSGAKEGAKKQTAKSTATADEVKTAIVQVKDTISPDAARAIIEKHAGKGKKLADLVTMTAKFDAALADAKAALEDQGTEEEEDETEEDDGL